MLSASLNKIFLFLFLDINTYMERGISTSLIRGRFMVDPRQLAAGEVFLVMIYLKFIQLLIIYLKIVLLIHTYINTEVTI